MQVLKHHKPETYSVKQWSQGAIEQQCSFACIDWDIFGSDLEERVSVITDYITFCPQPLQSGLLKDTQTPNPRSINTSKHPLSLPVSCYKSFLQPILLYYSTCFFNMLTANRNKLSWITYTASTIIGLPTLNLSDLNSKATKHKAQTIAHDPSQSPPQPLLHTASRYRIQVSGLETGLLQQKLWLLPSHP